MKLSKVQQLVVVRMQQGWRLSERMGEIFFVSRKEQKSYPMSRATLRALEEKGAIKGEMLEALTWTYSLTKDYEIV